MGYTLRIEDKDRVGLITTRTQNSRLLFIHNKRLENRILAALAKYQKTREVILYAFVLMGNHYHDLAKFLKMNRAAFQRDFNSQVARLTHRYVKGLEPGRIWGRRYSEQELPTNEDIESKFFYCALQSVTSGLSPDPNKYPQYNSFLDAISGVKRQFATVNWAKYNNAKRFNPNVDISRYEEIHTLNYTRLPNYEHLSQIEYQATMLMKYEQRKRALIEAREREGKKFPSASALLSLKPGDLPRTTKTSSRYSFRPLVLCHCPKLKAERERNYWEIKNRHRFASIKFQLGEYATQFPFGTYLPPILYQIPVASVGVSERSPPSVVLV